MTSDPLGPGWCQHTLTLAPDGTHPHPVATLVQPVGVGERSRAVLYLHGFTDYFFQADHAEFWTRMGWDFYALDLRDYGRSIRPGRTPNWITDLAAYDEEIGQALARIRTTGATDITLLGHSNGGLIASLYASDHPSEVDAVVLNNPWFDLNASWANRVITTRVLDIVGPLVPKVPVSTLGEAYGRSLHTSTGGDWEYNLNWKPIKNVPVYAAWLRAIRRGHARVAHGLDIQAPVLVCTSERSGHRSRPTEADLAGADCVLEVAHMWQRAPRVGADVTIARIDGGRHDLALSRPGARHRYEQAIRDWVAKL